MKVEPPSVISRLKERPAFVNFGWLSLDKIIRLVVGVFVGMWVARYLGPAGYGVLNYGVAVAALVTVVPALGLDTTVRRQLVRCPDQTGRILGTTFILRFGVSVVTYGLLLLGAHHFEPDATARLAIAMAGFSILQQPVLAIDLWFQSRLLSKNTVIAQNLAFTLCSVLRVVFVLQRAPLSWFLILLALESSVTSALLVAAYRRHRSLAGRWQWDRALAAELLRESWPLAIAAAATLVYVRIDQVMLRSMSGPAETGVYSAAARIMELQHALPLMLAASLSPGIVQARAVGREEYHFRLQRFFNLAGGSAWAATAVCALTAPWLVPLLFGPSFAAAGSMLVILAFSLPLIAMGVARQEYLINEGRQRFQLVTTLVGAVVNVALNVWAIPRWGGIGAAWVTVASHFAADLLTSLVWPPARTVAGFQLQALFAFWRRPQRSVA